MPPDDIDYQAIQAEQMPPPPPLVNLVSDDEGAQQQQQMPIIDQMNLLDKEDDGYVPISPHASIEPAVHSTATTTPGIEPVTPQKNHDGQPGEDVGKVTEINKRNVIDAPHPIPLPIEFEQLRQPLPALETEQVTQPDANDNNNDNNQSPSALKKKNSTLENAGTETVAANELDDDVLEPVTQTQDDPITRNDENDTSISPFVSGPDPLEADLPPLFPGIPIPQEEQGAIENELQTTTHPPTEEKDAVSVSVSTPAKRKPRVIDPRDEEEDKILPQVPNEQVPQVSNGEPDDETYAPETPDEDSTPNRRKRRGRPERRLREDPAKSNGLDSDPESSLTVVQVTKKKKRKSVSILSSDEESIKEVEVTPDTDSRKRRRRTTDDYASEVEDAELEDVTEPGRFYWQKTPGTRRRSRRIANGADIDDEHENDNNYSQVVPAVEVVDVVDVDELPLKNRKRKRPAKPGKKRQMPPYIREEPQQVDYDDDESDVNWLDYSPDVNPKKKNQRRRVKRSNYESDEKRVVSSRRKRKQRTRKRTIVSDTDDEDNDDLRGRRRRKRARQRRKNDAKSLGESGPYGYKKDGFVVSDNSDTEESSVSLTLSRDEPSDGGSDYSRPDGECSQESEPEDGLWAARKKQVKKALKGKRPPFPKAMVCVICKWAGNEALGTPGNGWRDGYVQPGSNFSASVKKGNYGKRMRKAYCLQHTAGDQSNYIARLELTAENNRMNFPSDDEDEPDDDDDSIRMGTGYRNNGNNGGPVQIVDDDEDASGNSYNNITYCGVERNANLVTLHDIRIAEDNADADVLEMNPENLLLSVEKTWLQNRSKDVQELTMHGAQWDWERGQYYIPPGKNIKPLRRFVVDNDNS